MDVDAHGGNSRFDVGTDTLAPSGARQLCVPLASLGITPERLEGPAVLTLRATTHDDAGADLDGVVTNSLYVSVDRRRGVVISTEERLLHEYNGGTITGGSAGPGQPPGTVNLFAGEGPGTFDPDAPGDVISSGLHTVCVHWRYASMDHNVGERYYANGEAMAARGVKLVVQQGNKLTSLYANKRTGCVSLPLVGGTPAKVTVFSEARIGTHENITVRAYESQALKDAKPKFPGENLKTWSYYLVPGGNPSHLYVPAGISSSVMAYGTFSIHRLDAEAPLSDDPRLVDFVHTDTYGNSFAGDTSINIDATQYNRKFVYGHEVGHWYQIHQSFQLSNDYSHHSTVDACLSAKTQVVETINLWHLMRSAEVNAAAFNEGLGHFFSSVVWNGTGWNTPMFKYYKDLTKYANDPEYGVLAEVYSDFTDNQNNNRIDLAAATAAPRGGIRAWRDNVCQDDPLKYSVELDWARFFVNYLDGNQWWDDLTDLSEKTPNFVQLMDQLRFGIQTFYNPAKEVNAAQANADVYKYFLQAMPLLQQQDFVDRFEVLADRYGVDL
ncbi:MAG: hypothetical protein ACRD12_03895 [Acidimicrobiales bacterium]